MEIQNKDERTWAMLCHLSVFSAFFTLIGYIIAPLVIWLIKKDQYPLVDDQGKESVNFQISMTLYAAIIFPSIFFIVGIPLIAALVLFDIIEVIIAAINANDGKMFRYPLCIRFIK